LLIAHGSRQPEANADLLHIVEQLSSRGCYDHVQPSYLELAEPTILQGAERCVQQGAERVILLPYFLSAGMHVQRDLAEACRVLAERYAMVQFRLAPPLGRHPLLIDIALERAREAENEWQTRNS
jgi:sirohydrochlorin ferrochelatase